MAERVRVRELDDDEGNRLLRIIRRGSGSALRYFTLDGTDHPSHEAQGSMIRRYIAWRNRHTHDPRLRRVVERANVA